MKKLITLFLILFLFSCNKHKVVKTEYLTANVTIAEVNRLKYSTVYGVFTYQGMTFFVNNGSSGYYYKEYNLSPGQVIKTTIVMTYVETQRGVEMIPSTLNVFEYEIK